MAYSYLHACINQWIWKKLQSYSSEDGLVYHWTRCARSTIDQSNQVAYTYIITVSWRSKEPMTREWGKLSMGHSPHWSSPPQAAWGTQPQSSTRGLPHSLQTSGSSHTARCCTGSDADWVFCCSVQRSFVSEGEDLQSTTLHAHSPSAATKDSLCWGLGPILCLTLHTKHHYLAWTLSLVSLLCMHDGYYMCTIRKKHIRNFLRRVCKCSEAAKVHDRAFTVVQRPPCNKMVTDFQSQVR